MKRRKTKKNAKNAKKTRKKKRQKKKDIHSNPIYTNPVKNFPVTTPLHGTIADKFMLGHLGLSCCRLSSLYWGTFGTLTRSISLREMQRVAGVLAIAACAIYGAQCFVAPTGLLDSRKRVEYSFGDSTESAVSNTELSEFFFLTEFRGENSVSSSQPMICVPKRTHRVFRRTHRVCPKTQ